MLAFAFHTAARLGVLAWRKAVIARGPTYRFFEHLIPIRIKKDSWGGGSQDRTSVIRFLNRESDSGGREMAAPVKVTREEHAAQDLRRLAADLKDAGHARRRLCQRSRQIYRNEQI